MTGPVFSQRMDFFSRLLLCGPELFYWEYDPALRLLTTTCPDADTVAGFMDLSGCREYLANYLQDGGQTPLVLSCAIGLNWIAAMEKANDTVCRVYLIGPAFTSDMSPQTLEQELSVKGYEPEICRSFLEQLEKLPIVPLASWLQYGKMLHFSVNSEEMEISDFVYQTKSLDSPLQGEPKTYVAKGNTWLVEQEAMRMIEEGKMDYKQAFGRLSQYSAYVEDADNAVQMRKWRRSLISLITLSTRAAIRGGLDVETSYFVGEQYIQSVEASSTLSEMMQIGNMMFEDFVRRVHKVRQSDGISAPIRACRDYIDLHVGENITLPRLASQAGYAEYYLARKFKQEVGVSISQYIQQGRLSKAKQLLQATNLSVQEIAGRLGYSSSSRFIQLFREGTGVTPGEYRNNTIK